MKHPVRDAYAELVRAGEVRCDAAQQRGAAALDRLVQTLGNGSRRILGLFGKRQEALEGVYLWGPVGRGKTMLMGLGFNSIQVQPKRRVHFHAFMLETHQRLREARESETGDSVEAVAEQIADEARLLAFDELQVTNPADAMILSRLFGKLLERGVRVIATSNRLSIMSMKGRKSSRLSPSL